MRYVESKESETIKCPACSMVANVAKGITKVTWIDCQINNLKVKCAMSVDVKHMNSNNKENVQVLANKYSDKHDEVLAKDDVEGNSRAKRNKKDNVNNKKIKLMNNKCNWTGNYGDFKKHKLECSYKINQCYYCLEFGIVTKMYQANKDDHYKECLFFPTQWPRCNERIQRRMLQQHLDETCVAGLISCEKCKREFPRIEEEYHKAVCPFQFITCRWINYGCQTAFQRRHQEAHEKGAASEHLYMVKGTIDQIHQLKQQNLHIIERIKKLEKHLPIHLNETLSNATFSDEI